jgi:hypothetical protein
MGNVLSQEKYLLVEKKIKLTHIEMVVIFDNSLCDSTKLLEPFGKFFSYLPDLFIFLTNE